MEHDENHRDADSTSVSFEYEAFGGVYKWKVEADVDFTEDYCEVSQITVSTTDDESEFYDQLPASLQLEINEIAETKAMESKS